MAADARVSAWICAWYRMNAARELMTKHGQRPGVGAHHEVLLDEARIFTDLAQAPEDVGLAAGEFLQQQEQEQAERKTFAEAAVDALRKRRDADGGP